MALEKVTTSDAGVNGNYLRLTKVTIDTALKISNVELSLYVDKACREAGLKPLTAFYFRWTQEDGSFPFLGEENTYKAAYAQIKLDPRFSDAVDT